LPTKEIPCCPKKKRNPLRDAPVHVVSNRARPAQTASPACHEPRQARRTSLAKQKAWTDLAWRRRRRYFLCSAFSTRRSRTPARRTSRASSFSFPRKKDVELPAGKVGPGDQPRCAERVKPAARRRPCPLTTGAAEGRVPRGRGADWWRSYPAAGRGPRGAPALRWPGQRRNPRGRPPRRQGLIGGCGRWVGASRPRGWGRRRRRSVGLGSVRRVTWATSGRGSGRADGSGLWPVAGHGWCVSVHVYFLSICFFEKLPFYYITVEK